MSTETPPAVMPTPATPRWMLWTGRILSAFSIFGLGMSAMMKLTNNPQAVEGLAKFGYDPKTLMGLGIVELASTVLYAIPQTSVLGAILLTGYLGGATATHVRVSEGFAAPIILGVLVWGGLVLREARLRSILPWRS